MPQTRDADLVLALRNAGLDGLVTNLKAERDRYREALTLIAEHARLDLAERGVAEAKRYVAIAEDALR